MVPHHRKGRDRVDRVAKAVPAEWERSLDVDILSSQARFGKMYRTDSEGLGLPGQVVTRLRDEPIVVAQDGVQDTAILQDLARHPFVSFYTEAIPYEGKFRGG
ncbi:hypothetical protein U1Q18_001761 [Sarracenia purpurea var. burkii]